MKVSAKTLAKIGIAIFLTYIAIYYCYILRFLSKFALNELLCLRISNY